MKLPTRVFLWVLSIVASASVAWADVPWRTGAIEPVITDAQRHNTRILVDFWAVWCGPCQSMDGMIWNRDDVTHAVAQGWVPLRVDADTPVGAELRQRYHIGSLPTVLALRPDGTEIDRLTGDATSAVVLSLLQAWSHGQSTVDVLAQRLQQSPTDLALRLDVGTRYADRGDEPNARLHLERAVADDPQNARGIAAQALLMLGDRLYLRSRRDAAAAVPHLQRLVTAWPATDSGSRAFVPLATALHRTHHDAEALAVIDRFVAAATNDNIAARSNSVAWMMFREGWDLPRAERIARAGMQRAPRNDALIDTLAEIVFAQGRAPEAVELETTAARINPGSTYYRQQLERFRRGIAATAGATPAPGAASATTAHGTGPSTGDRATRRPRRTRTAPASAGGSS